MKKPNDIRLILVSALMIISLSGIVIIQVLWLKELIKANRDQFSLKTREALLKSSEILRNKQLLEESVELITKSKLDSLDKRISVLPERFKKSTIYKLPYPITHIKDTHRITIQHHISHEINKHHAVRKSDKDILKEIELLMHELKDNERVITVKIDTLHIEKILREELELRGVNVPFKTRIRKDPSIHNQSNNEIETAHNTYIVDLFPRNIFKEGYDLQVTFNNRYKYNLQSIGFQVALSFLLFLIILFTFIYTLKMFLKQRKIAAIKSDYIKNMSHELKTPLATISLAVDSIESPQVFKSEKQINFFTSRIKTENKRMRQFIENVLQVSMLEKDNLELDYKKVKLNNLVKEAVNNIELLLKSRDGSIDISSCDKLHVLADEIHFVNAIYNLLDNSIKYSEHKPHIEINCRKESGNVILTIKDRGIGIDKKYHSQIFNDFYRVPTKNIHNTKGHGLGLSYVKNIIKAHNGTIKIQSSLGEGTEVIIQIPVLKNE